MRRANLTLTRMLSLLTCLFITWQVVFFTIHYQLSDLIDAIVKNSFAYELLTPTVLKPLLQFISLQLILYALIIYWTWFISKGISYFFRFSMGAAYWIGICYWCLLILLILCLNNLFYPNSFFASFFKTEANGLANVIFFCSIVTGILVMLPVPFAFASALAHREHRKHVGFFVLLFGALLLGHYWDTPRAFHSSYSGEKPHIILIGLDSVRPDHVGFYQTNFRAETPSLDQFLQSATVYPRAYSPLARTYPAWISILTGRYPKHNAARINMTNPGEVIHQPLLSKTLQDHGYETIYATDEPRFVDIDESYGFHRIIGPRGGLAEFLLGSLADFPLANLSLKLPFSRYWYPYQFGNRAAWFTYEPSDFITLMAHGLADASHKPLFVSVHLCLAHWPHAWSQSNFTKEPFHIRYQLAIKKLDEQVGQLLQLLSISGILQNSIVILFSDHGTALGLPHDRTISLDNYQGSANHLSWMPVFKRTPKEGISISQDFALDTSYGQGTDVLSLRQHEIVFAMRDYRQPLSPSRVTVPAVLIDIAPTLHAFLGIKPLNAVDGIALVGAGQLLNKLQHRPIFFETADTMGEIEQPNINVMTVVHERLSFYAFDSKRGIVYIHPRQKTALLAAKQFAVLENEVLFAHYPASLQVKFAPTGSKNHFKLVDYHTKPFFVWVNLKTGLWSMGEEVPLEYNHWKELLTNFYQDEL